MPKFGSARLSSSLPRAPATQRLVTAVSTVARDVDRNAIIGLVAACSRFITATAKLQMENLTLDGLTLDDRRELATLQFVIRAAKSWESA